MSILARELFATLILIIATDGVGAAFAARSCWRIWRRRRVSLSLPLTVLMAVLALTSLNDVVVLLTYGSARDPESAAFVQSLIGRFLRAMATWYLALRLVNGYSRNYGGESNETTTTDTRDPGGPGDPDC